MSRSYRDRAGESIHHLRVGSRPPPSVATARRHVCNYRCKYELSKIVGWTPMRSVAGLLGCRSPIRSQVSGVPRNGNWTQWSSRAPGAINIEVRYAPSGRPVWAGADALPHLSTGITPRPQANMASRSWQRFRLPAPRSVISQLHASPRAMTIYSNCHPIASQIGTSIHRIVQPKPSLHSPVGTTVPPKFFDNSHCHSVIQTCRRAGG